MLLVCFVVCVLGVREFFCRFGKMKKIKMVVFKIMFIVLLNLNWGLI